MDSYLGRSAHSLQNNIGLAYTICAISMAIYSDKPNQASALAKVRPRSNPIAVKIMIKIVIWFVLLQVDAPRHLAQQITLTGRLPHEDAPHDLFSFGYHVGDLIMLFEMALVANQTTGLEGFDVYNFHTNTSGSLATAIAWVAPFCANAAPWPIGPVSPIGAQDAECVILFRMAANTFHNKDYEAVSQNATSTINNEFCYGMDARTFMDLMWPSVFAEKKIG